MLLLGGPSHGGSQCREITCMVVFVVFATRADSISIRIWYVSHLPFALIMTSTSVALPPCIAVYFLTTDWFSHDDVLVAVPFAMVDFTGIDLPLAG